MPRIRIPKEHWNEVWIALVEVGAISRVSVEPIYLVSKKHIDIFQKIQVWCLTHLPQIDDLIESIRLSGIWDGPPSMIFAAISNRSSMSHLLFPG